MLMILFLLRNEVVSAAAFMLQAPLGAEVYSWTFFVRGSTLDEIHMTMWNRKKVWLTQETPPPKPAPYICRNTERRFVDRRGWEKPDGSGELPRGHANILSQDETSVRMVHLERLKERQRIQCGSHILSQWWATEALSLILYKKQIDSGKGHVHTWAEFTF